MQKIKQLNYPKMSEAVPCFGHLLCFPKIYNRLTRFGKSMIFLPFRVVFLYLLLYYGNRLLINLLVGSVFQTEKGVIVFHFDIMPAE